MEEYNVDDVLKWFRLRGVQNDYSAQIRDNAIDGAALVSLSESDLKNDLAITALGDRKKILRLIDELNCGMLPPTADSTPITTPNAISKPQPESAEKTSNSTKTTPVFSSATPPLSLPASDFVFGISANSQASPTVFDFQSNTSWAGYSPTQPAAHLHHASIFATHQANHSPNSGYPSALGITNPYDAHYPSPALSASIPQEVGIGDILASGGLGVGSMLSDDDDEFQFIDPSIEAADEDQNSFNTIPNGISAPSVPPPITKSNAGGQSRGGGGSRAGGNAQQQQQQQQIVLDPTPAEAAAMARQQRRGGGSGSGTSSPSIVPSAPPLVSVPPIVGNSSWAPRSPAMPVIEVGSGVSLQSRGWGQAGKAGQNPSVNGSGKAGALTGEGMTPWPENVKQALCPDYARGFCSSGVGCIHAHGPDDIQCSKEPCLFHQLFKNCAKRSGGGGKSKQSTCQRCHCPNHIIPQYKDVTKEHPGSVAEAIYRKLSDFGVYHAPVRGIFIISTAPRDDGKHHWKRFECNRTKIEDGFPDGVPPGYRLILNTAQRWCRWERVQE